MEALEQLLKPKQYRNCQEQYLKERAGTLFKLEYDSSLYDAKDPYHETPDFLRHAITPVRERQNSLPLIPQNKKHVFDLHGLRHRIFLQIPPSRTGHSHSPFDRRGC